MNDRKPAPPTPEHRRIERVPPAASKPESREFSSKAARLSAVCAEGPIAAPCPPPRRAILTQGSPQWLGSNSKLGCNRSPTIYGAGRNYAGPFANGHGARVAAIKKHPVPGAKIGKRMEH
jgi:hypothetical protein